MYEHKEFWGEAIAQARVQMWEGQGLSGQSRENVEFRV